MSLLSYVELVHLVDLGVINAPYSQINATSIDITLGDLFYMESNDSKIINMQNRETPFLKEIKAKEGGHGIVLEPGEFILAQSKEVFNLPDNISAEYKLNSSLARSGLDHLNAGWCDSGWNGSVLTLEFKNCLRYQRLRITPGMKAGQMIFFKHTQVPNCHSYANKGSYNGDLSVTESKEDRKRGILAIRNDDS